MKRALTFIATAYVVIGLVFSLPMAVSYVYAGWYVVWTSGFTSFGPSWTIMLGSVLIRQFLWAPSLLWWFAASEAERAALATPTFWHWLAPGFFIEMG